MKKNLIMVLTVVAVNIVHGLTEDANGYTWYYRIYGDGVEIYNNGSRAISPSPRGGVTLPRMLGGRFVKRIGDSAFCGCSEISVILGLDYVMSIGADAFKDCSGLTQANIGNVKSIEARTFSGCSKLQRVTMSNSVTNIGSFAFSDCKWLHELTIPDSAKRIGSCAFSGSGLIKLTLPQKVDSMPWDALWDCKYLDSIAFPDGMTEIPAAMFMDMKWLKSLYIPASITNIWKRNCYLGGGSDPDFYYGLWCGNSLISISVNHENANYSSTNGLLLSKDGTTLFAGVNGDVTIPDSVTQIASGAFAGCSGLKNVTFPNSIQSIGERAFKGCNRIQTITFPADIVDISTTAFENCNIETFFFDGMCPSSLRQWFQCDQTVYQDGSGASYLPKGKLAVYPWFSNSFPSSFKYVYSVGYNNGRYSERNYAPEYEFRMDKILSFSPTNGTVISGRQDVELTAKHPSVRIRYTTDGSDPTINGTWYSQKFAVRDKTTVRAVGYWNDTICSVIEMATYGLGYLESPVITVSPGNPFYHRGAVVSITCPTDGATIRYTIDGSTPSATNGVVYVSPFTIDETTTVKAIAVNHASYFDSDVACQRLERVYVPVENPVISSDSGSSFTGEYCTVSISCATEGATIYYTTDGASPKTAGNIYTGPFKVYESATVCACATKDDYADSAIASFDISNVQPFAPTPQICLKGGGLNASGGNRTVRIWTDETVDAIYYTLDGTTPTEASARYTSPFLIDSTVTIKAFSRKNAHRNSSVVSATIAYSRGMGDALGCPDLPWVATDADWREVQSGHAGTTGLQSTAIGDGDTTEISTTVFGPGDISFWWKTSCQYDNLGEYYYDHAELWIDGMCIAMLDGESDWVKVEHSIVGTGSHTISWRYVKDGDVSVGSDCLWLSDVRWSGKDISVVEITFNANGGTVSPATQIVMSGGTIGELPIPTHEQGVFAGWWTAVDGGTQISASTIVTDVATYYAHWILNQYAVTFDANGGMGGTSGKQDYGTEITVPTVTREGYTFVGWSPDVATAVPAHDVIYTAQWTPNSYSIAYNANGGSGTMDPTAMTYDSEGVVASNGFVRAGHIFAGWATNVAGEVVYTGGQSVMNLTAKVGGVITLYAVWEAEPSPPPDPIPEISSDLDVAGALMGSADTRLTGYIKTAAQYNAYRGWVDAKGLDHQTVKSSPRAWFSYAIGADGLVEQLFQNGDVVINSLTMASRDTFMFELDVKDLLISRATSAENLITVFEVQGSSSLEASSFSSTNVTVSLGVSTDGRLSATVTPKNAHETFFVRMIMHVDAEASGDGGTGMVPVSSTVTVTFDANGGKGGTVATKTYGAALGVLPTPTRDGCEFDGWFTATNGGTQVRESTVVTADVTYFAHWTESIGGNVMSSEGLYCVIDLSAGTNAVSYPVTYMSTEPSGGFNTDEYKTTKLVLRLIEPGSFMMGGSNDVTLTKAYYMGIFEVTQKQYELVMGNNPSAYMGDMRPVEKVKWDTIRGDSATCDWPNSTSVNPSTFVGRLQARTGLNFDLPTEAQWEYACRAGTTSAYNNGSDSKGDLKLLGRYNGNQSDGKGGYSEHTTVGSYQPNAWGLYDMHGNVWERCLDWYGDLSSGVTDPVGSSSGVYRVERGGGWSGYADRNTSSVRYYATASFAFDYVGFRLARTLSEVSVTFDANGGVGGTAIMQECGTTLTAPTVSREGYTFTGWLPAVTATVPTSNVTYIAQWTVKPVDPDSRKKVQLWEGGPYWATTNIGAEEPYEYGYYFWWGDTVGYKWENDAWVASDGSGSYQSSGLGTLPFYIYWVPTMDKEIATLQSEGWVTTGNVLSPMHDAAHVLWGGSWRMPTDLEMSDLNSKCDWSWTTMNGVNGYVVRGRGDYASSSIFLPATGNGYYSRLENAGSRGNYWSSVPDSGDYEVANYLGFIASGHSMNNYYYRSYGFPVRPVQGSIE